MDIERVTRRARQLIEAPAPIVPSRKADPVILIQRAEGSFECSLFHPSISGPTPLERGYVIVTDLTVARGLARIYGKGWGPHQVAPRDVYVEQQAAARVAHAAYLRGLPKPPEAAVLEPAEFAAVAVDLSPVLDALKAQPAAVVAALKAAL